MCPCQLIQPCAQWLADTFQTALGSPDEEEEDGHTDNCPAKGLRWTNGSPPVEKPPPPAASLDIVPDLCPISVALAEPGTGLLAAPPDPIYRAGYSLRI